ncbi:MAG: response regulator [Deltaproteobacteria bacterium]|nr:response regulator [Deltaproteobacteria bacterium]
MRSAKVLLVDDEKGFTETLSERLQLRNLTVYTASSGQEAIELANQHRFDAVILDLQMPGMDGIDTLKQLLGKDADLQVLILTGHGTVTKGVEAIKAGATEFLEKPVDIQTLTEKIGTAATQRVVLTEERSAQAIDDILKRKGW